MCNNLGKHGTGFFFASWTDIYQKHIIIVFALFCPILRHCESCDKQFKKDMMKGLFVHLIEFSGF